MAAEFIDDTENGSGLYPTKIPGYEDAADIQEALRLYHYGSTIIPTEDALGTVPNGINTKSVAGYLKALSNADAANALTAANNLATEVTNRTDADTNLQTQINNISSTIGLQTTVESKTSSFTLSLADAGKMLALNTVSGMTVTVPPNSSVSIPVGYQYNLLEVGSGQTQFAAGSGVLVNSKNSQMFIDSRYGKATLLKIGTDEWVLFGDIYEGSTTSPVAAPITSPVAPPSFPPAPIHVDPPSFPPAPVTPPVTPPVTAPTSAPVTAPTSAPVTAPTSAPVTAPVTAPVSGTTYYGCCTNGLGVDGVYSSSGDAVTGLNAACAADEQGNTLSGGVYTSPTSCNSPVAAPVTAPVSGTTYYGCCDNGAGVSGVYSSSGDAVLGLDAACEADEPGIGNNLQGGVYTTPTSCNAPVAAPVTAPTTAPVSGGPYCRTEQRIVPQSQCTSYEANFTVCYSDPAYTNETSATFVSCVGAAPVTAPTSAPVTAPVSGTTYYGCCDNGAGVSGVYSSSGEAVTGLNAACEADEPGIGNNLQGGVYTSPTSCNAPVAPVAPAPVAPAPVTPAPVAPAPVAPAPVAPAPVAPAPVAPAPVAPAPVNSLCSDYSVLNQSQCQACGGTYDATYGECYAPGTAPAPVAPAPSFPFFPPFFPPSFPFFPAFNPAPVAPAPVAPAPVAPAPVAPAPVAPAPVAPAPVSPFFPPSFGGGGGPTAPRVI